MLAQTQEPINLRAPAQKINPLDNGAILLRADEASYDPAKKLYSAVGRVEVTYDQKTLIADELTYSEETGIVSARGNIILIDETGDTLYADFIELDGTLRTGVIEGLNLVMAEQVKLAAARATRKENDVTELEQAIYSPCKVCKETGDLVPLWQIKALHVEHDKNRQVIRYKGAYLEVGGVPVFYLPYFTHADPSVKRKSGFLVPRIGNSSDLGNFAEIPYYWALADNYDVTLTPMILTEETSVMKAEFRMRTKTGEFKFDGSVTQANQRDELGNEISGKQTRNHLFGTGRFQASPEWEWGFDVGLTGDDTYLKKYDISFEDELTNRVFLEGRSKRNFAQVEAYYFRGLRAEDDPGTTPIILPNATFEYFHDQKILGGQLSFSGNFLALHRTEGTDVERLTYEAGWNRRHNTPGGHLFEAFADLRADIYHLNDLQDSPTVNTTKNEDWVTRLLPTIGMEWRYPLVKQGKNGTTQYIEPIAQLILSPLGGNPDQIPNEDSLSFEFDHTNLFTANRFTGRDRWDDGTRINLGAKVALFGRGARENSLFLGQSFRLQDTRLFGSASGLDGTRSDYVGRLTLEPWSFLKLDHRFRFDRDNF